MTDQKPWPKNAATVRDGSAEVIQNCQERLREIIDKKDLTPVDHVKIVGGVMDDLSLVTRSLESVGACTNPINELDNRRLSLKGVSFK